MRTKQANIKRNVLIIDDDLTTCKQLEKEFSRNFFNTFQAHDGETGLKIIEDNAINILILDVKLPDIDGLEVLRHIKDNYPDCEVIIITGFGNIDIAIKAIRNGATDYIEKPIDFDDLTAACGRAIEKLAEKEKLSYKNTVLVIDDEKLAADNIKKFLEKEGYIAFTAYSGEQGIEIINNNKIDVVLCDIKMAGISGLEVLRKAKSYYTDIEFIMVTGHTDTELSIQALRAGAIDYIIKPVNLDELLIAVQKAIKIIGLNQTRLYRDRELKLTSQVINKMNEELERRIDERTKELSKTQTQLFQTSKLATLGEMSAGLAHEINQPLGGISLVAKTFRKLLDRDRLDKEEIEDGLNDIESSVYRMKRIIQHIRTFARQDTLKFVTLQVNDTIDSALSLMGEQLRLHNIEVVRQFCSDLPEIAGEPYQLEQVWINLISNARDALDEK